jgi:hypothetical protein
VGISLYPSGIKMFITQGMPVSSAKYSAIFKQAMLCFIQYLLTISSGEESVRPSYTIGCEK